MKKFLFGLMAGFLFLVACDDDDNNTPETAARVSEIKSTAVGGQWRITRFIDSDTDETGNFNGFIFEFESDNTLTATNGSDNFPGTWSVTDDDSSGDDSNDPDDIDFNIAFTNPPAFEELSEDWEIISNTADKIELQHISGGNGGTDRLTFERI